VLNHDELIFHRLDPFERLVPVMLAPFVVARGRGGNHGNNRNTKISHPAGDDSCDCNAGK